MLERDYGHSVPRTSLETAEGKRQMGLLDFLFGKRREAEHPLLRQSYPTEMPRGSERVRYVEPVQTPEVEVRQSPTIPEKTSSEKSTSKSRTTSRSSSSSSSGCGSTGVTASCGSASSCGGGGCGGGGCGGGG